MKKKSTRRPWTLSCLCRSLHLLNVFVNAFYKALDFGRCLEMLLDGNHRRFSLWCEGFWSYQVHQSEFKKVQLTSASFQSAPFFSVFKSRFLISGWCRLTLITYPHITRSPPEIDLLLKITWRRKKNHLRNMVKENDTWQFTNCYFMISKSPSRARPTHVPLTKILTDSRFVMEARKPLLHLFHVSVIALRIFFRQR